MTEEFEAPETLTKSCLNLVSPDGKSTVTLQANDGYVGLWMSNNSGQGELIAIYSLAEQRQTCIGLYNRDNKRAINVGLVVDHTTGQPYIQFAHNGELKTFSMEEIASKTDTYKASSFNVAHMPNPSV